ncbi:4Fe-4S dicluster domain-containing protein [Clostridiaceae bacterium M8S5]|nr:4Fe-4S dicluster domain-containing protein [Clostridiaceae bacterium M8S5]
MELLDKIYNSGVVGVGGAGFPTHIKLNCQVEYLIINSAECEPLLEVDKYLMRQRSNQIIIAIEKMAESVKAEHMIIALKSKYKEEIKSLQNAIDDLKSNVKIHTFENFYPAGDEQVMVYEVTKRVIPAGGIPLDVGVVVNNVATVVNIYDAINDNPVVDKYLTVVGEVKEPKFLKAPIGLAVSEALKYCGGVVREDYKIILGGPMMGKIIDKEDAKTTYITKTLGSLIVIPADHYMVKRKLKPITQIINQARTACIQCKMCTDMCPRNLMGHQLRPHKIMRAMGAGVKNKDTLMEALICSECGVCELYACPMGLSPRLVNAFIKNELRNNGVRYDRKPLNEVNQLREYRKVPVSRLISRLDLNIYKDTKLGEIENIKAQKVYIPLSQHIGKPASPVVKVGDIVEKGQLIGKIELGTLGANIHASISGKVCEVGEYIAIMKDSEVNQ